MNQRNKILALEPFYGGSHRSFLDGLMHHSRHQFTLLSLSDRHWKWNFRAASVEFARKMGEMNASDFDLIFTSSMLDFATLKGCLSTQWQTVPSILMMHENQFDYPDREKRERDVHFAFSNFTSALSAEKVWFNSSHNQATFLAGLDDLSNAGPTPIKYDHPGLLKKMHVVPLAIDRINAVRTDWGVPQILWNHRWEHDKGPDQLAAAVAKLVNHQSRFRLVLTGQRYSKSPDELIELCKQYPEHVVDCANSDIDQYHQIVVNSDIVVSTANQENFGLSIMECKRAGLTAVLPNRLCYPEYHPEDQGNHFYDSSDSLVEKLTWCIANVEGLRKDRSQISGSYAQYDWPVRILELDNML